MSETVWVVLPEGYDSPERPSGGNRYAIELIAQLRERGLSVTAVPVAGTWPTPDAADREELARAVANLPVRETVIVDGLVGVGCPELVSGVSGRLVVLLHMSFADAGLVPAMDQQTLVEAADAVVVPSASLAENLAASGVTVPVHVIGPGVDAAPATVPSADGSRWLCVATVVPAKGYDDLLTAVGRIPGARCRCVGSLTVDPDYADALRINAPAGVEFVGALERDALADEWSRTDLLILASHSESYGMVVTEALAHGIPVIATHVGGIPEALGSHHGEVPGLLVPPADPDALVAALEYWSGEPPFREAARAAALARRADLPTWESAGEAWLRVLSD